MTATIAKPHPFYAWFLAFRPKTLTAGILPVVVGTTLGALDSGFWEWEFATLALIFAIAIQTATNLFNDAIDFEKGTDTAARLGPDRATQKGWLSQETVKKGGCIALLIAALAGAPIIYVFGYAWILLIASSIFLAYIYTGGRYPLSYLGLGDLFVFLYFGLAATLSSYYFQAGELSWPALLAAVQLGSLSTMIIAMNNLRDVQSDRLAAKKTIPVRFGVQFAKWEVTVLAALPFLLNICWLEMGGWKIALLATLPLPLAKYIVSNLWATEPSKYYNHLFVLTALLLLVFGCLLTVGLLVAWR